MINSQNDLEALHNAIAACRTCEGNGLSVSPSTRMLRGSGTSEIMVVGIEPGNTELDSGEAFTGQAGKKLMQWLEKAGLGNNREEIFAKAYFTSLLKCKTGEGTSLKKCYKYCGHFLHRQIILIKPKILITLGNEPMKFLFGYAGGLDECIGHSYTESEMRGYTDLTPLLEPEAIVIPLPHPSPLSHWLNKEENNIKLAHALDLIREHL